jgi:hypothetical protein
MQEVLGTHEEYVKKLPTFEAADSKMAKSPRQTSPEKAHEMPNEN